MVNYDMITIGLTKEETIAKAAKLFTELASHAVSERGCFHVVLAGGETPRQLYELLAQSTDGKNIPWSQIHVYWGDERCVPSDHQLSNQQMVRQSLLDHVNIPKENVHAIAYDESPENMAINYEKLMRSLFNNTLPRFDLILLGIGEDGHTASLFPSTEVLTNQKDWVGVGYLKGQNVRRITLTIPVLNNARNISFLVMGAKKALAVKTVLELNNTAEPLPAQLIKPVMGNVTWIIDQEAAALLHTKKEI